MEKNILKDSFNSDIKNIKPAVEKILDFINKNIPGIDKNDICDLKLIFNELLINAVVHGNKSNIYKKVILKVAVKDKNTIKAFIIDEGEGFCFNNDSSSCNESYDENGRGLCIVCSLADEISLNIKGNEVMFKKRVNLIGQNSYSR